MWDPTAVGDSRCDSLMIEKTGRREIPNGFSRPGHIAISGFSIRGNLENIAMVNPMVY